MGKILAWVLILVTFSGASTRTVFASAEHLNKQAAKLKLQIEGFPPGTSIKVKLKDHREIEGELVARSEGGFELAASEPVTLNYTEVKDVAEDPGGQPTSGSSQSPPRHHGHFLRNALIGLGACFAFALIVAVASK